MKKMFFSFSKGARVAKKSRFLIARFFLCSKNFE